MPVVLITIVATFMMTVVVAVILGLILSVVVIVIVIVLTSPSTTKCRFVCGVLDVELLPCSTVFILLVLLLVRLVSTALLILGLSELIHLFLMDPELFLFVPYLFLEVSNVLVSFPLGIRAFVPILLKDIKLFHLFVRIMSVRPR